MTDLRSSHPPPPFPKDIKILATWLFHLWHLFSYLHPLFFPTTSLWWQHFERLDPKGCLPPGHKSHPFISYLSLRYSACWWEVKQPRKQNCSPKCTLLIKTFGTVFCPLSSNRAVCKLLPFSRSKRMKYNTHKARELLWQPHIIH